jgi:hypothetical protein
VFHIRPSMRAAPNHHSRGDACFFPLLRSSESGFSLLGRITDDNRVFEITAGSLALRPPASLDSFSSLFRLD